MEFNADCSKFLHIIEEEVEKALKNTSKHTAPGLDKWKLEDLIKFSKKDIGAIFNKWYLDGTPKATKACRTILIHKGGDETDVGNWRPITIGPLLLRVYAKVWDQRLRKVITINERQKAFEPVDGCFENVKILQHVVQTARKERNARPRESLRHSKPRVDQKIAAEERYTRDRNRRRHGYVQGSHNSHHDERRINERDKDQLRR